MNDLRSRRKLPHIDVTVATLQWYACITMLFYSVSMSVIQNGMLHMHQLSGAQLSQLWSEDPDIMVLSSWAVVFQLLGGLAIPVFAFLLVERFLHTENYRKDLIRMVLVAVLSEIPFDFAMSAKLLDWSSQNLLITLSICLVMLYGLRMFQASKGAQLLIIIAAVLWSSLVKAQFGLCIVLLTAVYYLLREMRRPKLALSSVIGLMYVTAPLSNFVIMRYNGKPGKAWNRNLFYALYPAHLLILGAAAYWMA